MTSSGQLKSLSEVEYSNAGTNESDLKLTSDKHFAEVLTEDNLKVDQLFRVDLENKFRLGFTNQAYSFRFISINK